MDPSRLTARNTVASTTIQFRGREGQALSAIYDEPDGETIATAIFAHCFTCSKETHAATRIARGLSGRGIGVLRFDFTGLGESEGEFSQTTFASNIDDIAAAYEWLESEHRPPSLLVGHSLGGAAVLSAASELDAVRAIATIGAPADPAHVEKLFQGDSDMIRSQGWADVSIGGRPFRIRAEFLDDLGRQEPGRVISELRRELIVFHSATDNIVGVENAAMIFEWASHPKSFISLDTADHLLTRRPDAEFVSAVLAAWSSRFVP